MEGELVKIDSANQSNYIGLVPINTFKVLMTSVFEEDVIADLRERMVSVLKVLVQQNKHLKQINEEKDLVLLTEGNFNFIYRNTSNKEEIVWE